MLGHRGSDPPGHVLDERRVGDDEPLADPIIAFVLISPPQFAQLDRFDVRLQGYFPLFQARG